MKHRSSIVNVTAIGLLLATTQLSRPEQVNPYLGIGNTFGLKPPAPLPVPTRAEPTPPAPSNIIKLTGITNILPPDKALLEVIEPGNPDLHRVIMAAGDPPQHGVELLSIDFARGKVTVRSDGVVSDVSFETATASPPSPVPARSSSLRGGGPTQFPAPAATPTAVGTSRHGSSNSRNHILVAGGLDATKLYDGSSSVNTPKRPAWNPMTREQSIIGLELSREINRGQGFPPLPPTPITPQPTGFEQQEQD